MTYSPASPGVYVYEKAGVPSITGVGTSTAGFIGLTTDSATTATSGLSTSNPAPLEFPMGTRENPTPLGTGDGTKKEFELPLPITLPKEYDKIEVIEGYKFLAPGERTSLKLETRGKEVFVIFDTAPANDAVVSGIYTLKVTPKSESKPVSEIVQSAGEVKLCTNFTEFTKAFGQSAQATAYLEDAVYGFFRNGGTRCFVTVVARASLTSALEDFAAIDEIAIVAAPGCTDVAVLQDLSAHCEKLGDRVAIFDGPLQMTSPSPQPGTGGLPGGSSYAALYYPWIEVFDPVTQKSKYVPPSGHIAGIYARVDAQRGVHKAPANEVVLGAIGLEQLLTRAKQNGLNPQGVNCIRSLNGKFLVWGARTWGGKDNNEFKYINIRRLFNYLRESIDEGTQWAVFEPNGPELWAKVRRSVIAFLTMAWRSGALFGNTPEEAFFVQCDEETNPPDVRDAGQLVVKVGVAVTKPAEFVIFELSQWSGGQ